MVMVRGASTDFRLLTWKSVETTTGSDTCGIVHRALLQWLPPCVPISTGFATRRTGGEDSTCVARDQSVCTLSRGRNAVDDTESRMAPI